MIMNINDLKSILKKRYPYPDPRGTIGGNMCFNCGRDNCKFVLTGDMYFGQEVGEDENGNTIVYECPKYEFPTHECFRSWEALEAIEDAIDYMRYLAEVMDDLNKEAKLGYVYRTYSK